MMLMAIMPLHAESDNAKQSWDEYSNTKLSHAYLLANRLCDCDLMLMWPPLAHIAGYEITESFDLFLLINAARMALNVIVHQFDQIDQARKSLIWGFLIRRLAQI